MSIVKRARAFGYAATLIVAAIVLYVPIAVVFLFGALAARPLTVAAAATRVNVSRAPQSDRQPSVTDILRSA